MNRKIGIIAGSGLLPIRVAENIYNKNIEGCIIKLSSFSETNGWPKWPVYEQSLGKIGAIISKLKSENVSEVILCGGINRPDVSNFKTDVKGFKLLSKIAFKGDDKALKVVINFIENEGFKISSASDFGFEFHAPEGHFAGPLPDSNLQINISKGVEVLDVLSPSDVGQSIAIQQGLVLAIEAIEGTDKMVSRAGKLKKSGVGPVLIKSSKTNQDMRVDQPVIGPQTIKNVSNAGFSCIAFKRNTVLILDLESSIKKANELKITLYGFD